MDEADPSKWFRDTINPDFVQLHRFSETVYSGKTGFQSVDIIQTNGFGKCLVLDGKLQSAETDEFIYHEALVHPALTTHTHPRTVFIAGGGEGSTLREVLRHSTVERAVMVDIDREAVDICRRYLPCMHEGAFDSSRVDLLHCDARDYLTKSEETFDAIIVDITDPLENGPSYLLYTEEFYRLLRQRLAPKGVIAVQSGSCALGDLDVFVAINKTLRAVFPLVRPYPASIPSFGGLWGFTFASEQQDPFSLSAKEVDGRIADRTSDKLRFYDGTTHRGMFCLPRYLREALDQGSTIITDEKPLLVH